MALPASRTDQQTLISLLPHVSFSASGVGGKPTIKFSGVNVQVVSGSGSTTGAVNGEGNLVVGYAENPSNRKRTGSNDLIVGYNNGWSSYGEILGGEYNTVTAPYATALGVTNTASGTGSFVTGSDKAAGGESSASGGTQNVASGTESSVSGGHFNQASDSTSSVVGGCENLAGKGSPLSGTCSSGAEAVLGGFENTASGIESTINQRRRGQYGPRWQRVGRGWAVQHCVRRRRLGGRRQQQLRIRIVRLDSRRV